LRAGIEDETRTGSADRADWEGSHPVIFPGSRLAGLRLLDHAKSACV